MSAPRWTANWPPRWPPSRPRWAAGRRGATPLAFDLLVPATSVGRKRLAEVLQEAWRLAGARVTVTAVEVVAA
mgnify:CR=1 FL=1